MAAASSASGTPVFAGVYTAVVTPFTPEGEVDWAAYASIIEAQVAAGVAGVVPCGTTGESPTLTKEEKHKVISEAIRIVAGRIQVIAGTGSNNTADSVAETRWAKEAGATACLLVNPYYSKPTQAGVIAHVKAVAAVGLPIVLYNIPGRSGINLTPATIAELRRTVPEVVAIKEAAGSVDQASEIIAASDIPVLSGDDGLTLPMMAVGAVGVVSVLSNLHPVPLVQMVAKAAAGDLIGARAIHRELYPLMKVLFVETNPAPVKRAMVLTKQIGSDAVRLPLVTIGDDSDAKVRAVMKEAGLIKE